MDCSTDDLRIVPLPNAHDVLTDVLRQGARSLAMREQRPGRDEPARRLLHLTSDSAAAAAKQEGGGPLGAAPFLSDSEPTDYMPVRRRSTSSLTVGT